MDAIEFHELKKIYRRIFIPLSTCFVIICLFGMFWDYARFIDSRKHLNERVISALQKLIQVRLNNIAEEANIVEARINHANSLNKITQALGTPVFSIPKTPRVYPFISAHYMLEKEKNFSLTPYGISDLVDFPREVLKKFPKASLRGEFYLWDDTLYYIRRIRHVSSKEFDGILILFCETKEILDSGYKHNDVNILLSTNTYPFLQPNKLEKAYGPLSSTITVSETTYDHYAIIPETSFILFVKPQEVTTYKIYIKQSTPLLTALLTLFLLIISSYLMFKFIFLEKISKLKYKTSIEEQYKQSIRERERILKEVFMRQQEHIRVLIDSYCLTSSHIDGSLSSDILTPQRLEELNLTVAKSSDALEDGILSSSKSKDIDVSEVLQKSIFFLFHEIYNKELKVSFQQNVSGVISHDPLVIELLFINVLHNIIKRFPHKGFINIFIKNNNDTVVVDITDQGYTLEIKSFAHELQNMRGNLFSLENERLLKLAEAANINIEVKNEFSPSRNSTTIEIPLKAFSIEKVVPANIVQFRSK